MHKPWNKHNTLEHILNNKTVTIDMFLRMIDRKESAIVSYIPVFDRNEICTTKNIEILVKKCVNHPDIDDKNLDKKALERLMGWIHDSHFTDNKLNDKCINDVTVDIGEKKDWSISDTWKIVR